MKRKQTYLKRRRVHGPSAQTGRVRGHSLSEKTSVLYCMVLLRRMNNIGQEQQPINILITLKKTLSVLILKSKN